MEENITFSGKEATPITFEALQAAIDLIATVEPKAHHFNCNVTEEQLTKVFGDFEKGTAKTILYGMPIYQRSYVPVGEIWSVDKNGKVLDKFKV